MLLTVCLQSIVTMLAAEYVVHCHSLWANATGLIKVTQSSGQLVSAHPLLGVTALTVLEFAEVLTQATSSLVGQSQQQGGVQAVVMGRHQLFKSDMGDQVSHGWGQGLGRLVLRAWSGQTQQPRALRPDS